MKKQIKTEIIIDAPIDKVWSILMDFEKYPTWNPFITNIQKNKKNQNKLKITIKPPKGNKMSFEPIITCHQTPKRYSWLGKLLITGIFDGEHIFELLENTNGSTTFIQTENFSGILVGFINLSKTAEGFRIMNESLKQVAEK